MPRFEFQLPPYFANNARAIGGLEGMAKSIGVVANAADGLEAMIAMGVTPDLLTDQTSAHDPLNGYVPRGLSLDEADALRTNDPDAYIHRSRATMADPMSIEAAATDAECRVNDAGPGPMPPRRRGAPGR